MKKLLFALPLFFIGFILFSCVSSDQETAPVDENQNIEETLPEASESESSVSYEYNLITESGNTYYLDYEIHFPKFQNNNSLNKAVEDYLLGTYRKITETAQELWDEENEARRMSYESQDESDSYNLSMYPFEFFGNPEQIVETEAFLSIVFDEYSYLGGAHGNPCKVTLNYSKEENRPISIDEISGMSLDEISYLCYEVLLERLAEDGITDLQWLQTGTEPTPENFGTFTITEDGNYLIVYFNPYQVAPYSYGTLSVKIEL